MSSVKIQLLLLVLAVIVGIIDAYQCKKRYQVQHGYVDFAKMDEVKGEVPVVCRTGYKAKPHAVMICRSDSKWSGATCAPKDCKKQYKIKKGKIDYKNTTYLSMASVSCNTGYKLVGHPHITCLADGTWSKNTTCEPRHCIANYSIPHGFVEFKGKPTPYNSKFLVKCDKGYEKIGDNHTVCQGDGTWSYATRCQPIDCGTNFTLVDGYADFHEKKTTYKSKVNVYCRTGYNMQGNDYITCGINGTWSNDTKCHVRECGTNHSIAHSNANFTGRSSHYGTIVPVYCDKGYTVTGNHFTTCQANGKWSNTKCMLKDCGKKYILENGKINFERKNTKYNAKIPVTCNTGYAVRGEKEIRCQANGKWSRMSICSEIMNCRSKLSVGLALACRSGEHKYEPRELFCDCTDCGTVYPLEHGYVEFAGQSTKYKSKIPVTCDVGYTVRGDSEIECLKTGKWSTKTSCSAGIFGEYTEYIFAGIGVGLLLILCIITLLYLKIKRKLFFA